MSKPIRIFLADDDKDDRFLFEEVLTEIPIATTLTTAENGVVLMNLLASANPLPDVLFLDLNMPLKTGQECLREIRAENRFNKLTIIVYSTSYSKDMAEKLKRDGANYYITKRGDFSELKRVIHEALIIIDTTNEYVADKYPYFQVIE